MSEEQELQTIKRWFSIGDILTGVAMLAALAASYGSLSARLEALSRDIQEIQQVGSGPTRTDIASLQAKDIAQDAAIQELRLQLREQRSEILGSLQRLESKLENHDRK